jgi:uncharacterized protein YwgA
MDVNDAGMLLELIAQSRKIGNWCGESYLQKASYIAHVVLELPLSVPFVLYKKGPYSFELKNLLMEMRANRLITLTPEGRYGPSFVLLESTLTRTLRDLVAQHTAGIERLVRYLSRKDIAGLEAFSTAIMFWNQFQDATGHVDELNRLLPTLSRSDAVATIEEAHEFLKRDQMHA